MPAEPTRMLKMPATAFVVSARPDFFIGSFYGVQYRGDMYGYDIADRAAALAYFQGLAGYVATQALSSNTDLIINSADPSYVAGTVAGSGTFAQFDPAYALVVGGVLSAGGLRHDSPAAAYGAAAIGNTWLRSGKRYCEFSGFNTHGGVIGLVSMVLSGAAEKEYGADLGGGGFPFHNGVQTGPVGEAYNALHTYGLGIDFATGVARISDNGVDMAGYHFTVNKVAANPGKVSLTFYMGGDTNVSPSGGNVNPGNTAFAYVPPVAWGFGALGSGYSGWAGG